MAYGSPPRFDRATKAQAAQFLDEFFAKWNRHGFYFRKERTENDWTLGELDMLASEVTPFIRALTAEDYYGGPIPDNRPERKAGPLWEFGTYIQGQQVYIKLQAGAPGAVVICVSFHFPEHPLSFPHKSA